MQRINANNCIEQTLLFLSLYNIIKINVQLDFLIDFQDLTDFMYQLSLYPQKIKKLQKSSHLNLGKKSPQGVLK